MSVSILKRILLILLVLLVTGCWDFFSWDKPKTGTAVAELLSPDKTLSAKVIATNVEETYRFVIIENKNRTKLAEKSISIPNEYHEPIISLKWSSDGHSVLATIDHDFGENNIVFELQVESTDA